MISAFAIIAGSSGEPSLATLEPDAGWDGSAASGFASGTAAPSDPTRTTAKPALRLLVPPEQRFTDELLVGVAAAANNSGSMLNLGLSGVTFNFEGNTQTVSAPSIETFSDTNGNSVSYWGYWVRLKKPAGTAGEAQLYVTATPADGTMQSRVIGPYSFFPQTTLHDYELTVAASGPIVAGESYQTLTAAINYLKGVSADNPKITITEAGNYPAPQSGSQYAGGDGYLTIEATAAITIGEASYTSDAVSTIRPRYDGIWFKGSNITFDMRYTSRVFHEGLGKPHWFDGVNITISGDGRSEYWRSGSRPVALFSDSEAYYTECTVTYYPDVFKAATLVRGGTVTESYIDCITDALCVTGLTVNDLDAAEDWALDVDAITIDGPATATISVSGASDANSRTITLKEGGATISGGTFTVGRTEALYTAANAGGYDPTTDGQGYYIQDVADWINSKAGWTATVIDNTRRASALGEADGKGVAFTDVDVSSPVTFVTMFDLHGDFYQQNNTGPTENVIVYNCTVKQAVVQNIFITGTSGAKDFAFFNLAFSNKAGGGQYDDNANIFSQLGYSHSHVVVAHVSMGYQGFGERSGSSYTADSYSLFANNSVRSCTLTNGARTNNHLHAGQTAPSGATGTSIGGDATTLYADIAAGDFSPAGDLLTNLVAPVVSLDAERTTRAATDAKGAIAA